MSGGPRFNVQTGEFEAPFAFVPASPFEGFDNVACARCWKPLVGHRRHSLIGIVRARLATWRDRWAAR